MNIPPPIFHNQEAEAIRKIERYCERYIAKMRAKGWHVMEIHDEIVLTPPEKETKK